MTLLQFPPEVESAVNSLLESLRGRDILPPILVSSEGYLLLKWEMPDKSFCIEIDNGGEAFWTIEGGFEDYSEIGIITKAGERKSIISDLEEFLNC